MPNYRHLAYMYARHARNRIAARDAVNALVAIHGAVRCTIQAHIDRVMGLGS